MGACSNCSVTPQLSIFTGWLAACAAWLAARPAASKAAAATKQEVFKLKIPLNLIQNKDILLLLVEVVLLKENKMLPK